MVPRSLFLSFAGSAVLAVVGGPSHGPTVQVSVQATDTYPLHYQWRSTDGTIKNIDAPTTSWTLPPGPGIHFAYVLVSNRQGGYTERRIAINSDRIGTPLSNTADGRHDTMHAPPAPAQVGDYYRGRESAAVDNANGQHVYLSNLTAYGEDLVTGDRYPRKGSVHADQKGEFLLSGVLPSPNLSVPCKVDGVTDNCTWDYRMLPYATSHYYVGFVSSPLVVGSFTLQDGSPCGTFNQFFGVHSTASATLLDASNRVIAGPVSVNEFGDYALPLNSNGVTVSLKCEGAPLVDVPYANGSINPLPTGVVANVVPPVVTGMTASLGGTALTSPVTTFLPPPVNLPSDIAPRADLFLAEKGLDTRLGACKYYYAVGAVKGCGPNGELIGAVTYQDWQKAVKIGQYASSGVPTFEASYINKVDLNLARIHQSITYGPNQTAAVVCNHTGASDFFNPTQTDIDNAVNNAVAGKNLVACVAMDYTISPGVNNNQPFIRFLIFGPSGQLLPSINLDGRREKFVPGTCVVCHGGDHYAGKYPEDGSGFANVGGHFLPYDAGNFEFASTAGLQKCDQQEAIYNLNQNVLNAGATNAERELIGGWYSTTGSTACPSTASHVLNEDYVPASWTAQDAVSVNFYKTVVARSCRTCHVAMVEDYNLDHYQNIENGTNLLEGGGTDFTTTVCGDAGNSGNFQRFYTMPNSLVTFNRFWLSYQNTAGIPDQASTLQQFVSHIGGDTCFPVPSK